MDSNQVSRRDFFRKAGIFSAAVVAPVATTVVITMPEAKKEIEDISHLKPEGNQNLVLQGGVTMKNKPPENGLYFFHSNLEYNNKVEMSVGKDNMLWLKVGDEWKRVLTT